MNNVRLTSNHDEYSRTITRPNGFRLDICVLRKEREVLIALVDEDANVRLEEISFTAQEAGILLQHLGDPETIAIIGGEYA